MADPSLRDLQRWMKARILPRPGAASAALMSPRLNPQRGAPGEERLAGYAGGDLARTREALREAYPAVLHLVGEPAFDALAHAYTERYPSQDYNLSLVGRHLPEWLPGTPLTHQLPFLPDLARLEWAVSEAFHAFEQTPAGANPLAALSVERADRSTLVFQPSVRLVASPWPILDLWQARHQARKTIDLPVMDRPQRVLVARRGLQVHCELVDERQGVLLESLLDGCTLGEACATLADRSGDAALPLSDWFARWVAGGLIVGFR